MTNHILTATTDTTVATFNGHFPEQPW